jgi:hypothetical protein
VEPLKRGRTNLPETEKIKPVTADVIEKTIPHLPKIIVDMIRLQGL